METQTFTPGFYRSKNCDCQAVIYIAANGCVRIFKGSTIVFHRPTVDGISLINGNSSLSVEADRITDNMVIDGNAIEQTAYERFTITADVTLDDVIQMTRAVVGFDDVNPTDFWEPVF